jgi:2-methylcitrate dehydratase PrpD
MSNNSATKILVEYAFKSTYGELPTEVIARAKHLIIDTIGCGFGGYSTKAGKILTKLSRSFGGVKEATIIGDSSRVPSKHAAFANAQMSRILDFDETYKNSGHPASSIVNTAIALGESKKASGKDVINSIVTAYEVTTRVIDAINPSMQKWKSGVYPFSTPDFLGAPIVAAKILKLDENKFYNAFAIGAQNARLPISGKGILPPKNLVKCSEGWQAEHGIVAALLAKEGYHGILDVMDGDRGFWAAAASDRCDYKVLTESLGERYNILSLSFKAQPVCRWVNPPIEAVTEIVETNNLSLSEIDSINVKSHTICTRPPYNSTNPFYISAMNSMVSAQFSIPWGVTVALLGYEEGPDWYSEDKYRNKELLNFAQKIKLEADEEADKCFAEDPLHTVAKVRIETKGRAYEKRVDYAKGDPQRPFDQKEIIEKFNKLTRKLLSKEKREKLTEMILNLDQLKDISKLPRQFF